ncbi:MAG: RNA polymerase sigma factor [Myxococcota bacterium]|nr:RNA polymerase sigma factor [Myxococcota bacterium]
MTPPTPWHEPRQRRSALSLRLHDNLFDEKARIRLAAGGDQQARAWIVERYTPIVYRYARRMLRHEQDARDATQDTLVKVLRSLDRYDDQWRFTTWVVGIARNTCIDEFRKRRRRSDFEAPELADPGPAPDSLAARNVRAERLHEALDALTPLYRDVLVLYHFEHLKYQEIADLLGIPIGTVMNRIFRARRKLRAAYEAQDAKLPHAIASGA